MSVYGYEEALEAAGATVNCAESFGSYQGDWYAQVTFEGKTFWVHGSYGSCSGCDAYQHEFRDSDDGCKEHEYDKQSDCAACSEVTVAYKQRLAEFGRGYLVSGEMTQEEAEKEAGENLEWDRDAQEMLDYVKAHAIA